MPTITIPARVITAFADLGEYQDTIQDEDSKDIPNPQTKSQFGKQVLIDTIKQMTKSEELDKVAAADRKTAKDAFQGVTIT